MIFDISIRNFLSFKEQVRFSFEATRDDALEETHVVEAAPGVRIGKLGVIYGANASGKTNLLEAFSFLIRFWRRQPKSKTEKTGLIPFLLDNNSKNEPSEFLLTFFIQNQKYVYSLVITSDKVIQEKLFYYPGTQPAVIFDRSLGDNVSQVDFGSKIKISTAAKEEIAVKCLTNTSVFAAYEAVNANVPKLENVSGWINEQLFAIVEPGSDIASFVEKKMLADSNLRSFVLNFLKEADYNISNISLKKESRKLPEAFLRIASEANIPQGEKNRLLNTGVVEIIKTSFTHKVVNEQGIHTKHDLPQNLQSNGTLRTLGVAGVISQAVAKNAFLTIDEIESSLHPKLVEFVLEQFLSLSDKAQLLVTTHNDSLLAEADLLRKDNIWFTSKKPNGASELYSLSDFQGLNRLSSLQKAYKFGKFGAVPNI